MSTLCDPIDSSPPGSPIPGILQARTLEWVAISFSNSWKWKMKVKSLNRVQLLATPWTAAHQAPPSMGFSRQEYWSGVPLPSLIALTRTRLLYLPPCSRGNHLSSESLFTLQPSYMVTILSPVASRHEMWPGSLNQLMAPQCNFLNILPFLSNNSNKKPIQFQFHAKDLCFPILPPIIVISWYLYHILSILKHLCPWFTLLASKIFLLV